MTTAVTETESVITASATRRYNLQGPKTSLKDATLRATAMKGSNDDVRKCNRESRIMMAPFPGRAEMFTLKPALSESARLQLNRDKWYGTDHLTRISVQFDMIKLVGLHARHTASECLPSTWQPLPCQVHCY